MVVVLLIARPGRDSGAGAEILDLAPDIAAVREEFKLPAVGTAVIVEGKLHALGVVGVRKDGNDVKAEPNDPFHMGSCTKAMTGSLIGLLVQQGKLKWETPLVEYFPELKDTMHPDYRQVTLVHLLSHRAGVPSMTAGFAPANIDATASDPHDEVARRPAKADRRDRSDSGPREQARREGTVLERRLHHRRSDRGKRHGRAL